MSTHVTDAPAFTDYEPADVVIEGTPLEEEWPDEAYTEPETDEVITYLYSKHHRDSDFWL